MSGISSALLGLRALNATRKVNLPTYVATRFLLESVAGSSESNWASTVLSRKYPSRKSARFQQALKYKKIGEGGELEYRDFVVPSPTTSVAESLVLAYLARSKAFEKKASVYSYLWPTHPGSPYNFEHYINGYKKRNEDIRNCAFSNPENVLIVSDITKFYPSIVRSTVNVRFNQALRASNLPRSIRETASSLVHHLFSTVPGERGVATGPELSHVIGDIALSRVDDVLNSRYPGAYFRYVDDVVLSVPVAEVDHAKEALAGMMAEEELGVNIEKTDVVTGADWRNFGPHNSHRVEPESFEALLFFLKAYLRQNPSSENKLSQLLQDEGFSLPIERLVSVSSGGKFGKRLMGLFRRGWWVAVKAVFITEAEILAKAMAVRGSVYQELQQLLALDLPGGSTRRRWSIQRLRYLVNRAVYLFPPDDLRFLIDPLRELPEFVETVALIKMLLGENPERMLRFPGAALMAGAGILKQTDRTLENLPNTLQQEQGLVESLSVLKLFGVVSPDITVENIDQSESAILRFSGGINDEVRVHDDFSYADEMASLGLSRTSHDNQRVLDTRFADGEGVVLDALDIGGESAY